MALRYFVFLTVLSITQSKLINLSCKNIRAFVDGHNDRRAQVARGEVPGQPPASEMKSVVWDDELAAKAAKWASNNRFEHNPDRTIGSGRFDTGESWYWTSSTDSHFKIDPQAAIDSWFEEYKNYNFGPLQSSDFEASFDIGHYTQLVWADTTYVGCGISETYRNGWHTFFVVCNYGPPGNYIGQAPYRTDGTPNNELICGIGDCSRQYGDRC